MLMILNTDSEIAEVVGGNSIDVIKKSLHLSVMCEMDRLDTMLLCESRDLSFTQQSQRYVKATDSNPNFLVSKGLDLYNRMIEPIDGDKPKGRPTRASYKYGILPEEARSILPLAMGSIIVVTGSIQNLYSQFSILNDNSLLTNLKKEVTRIVSNVTHDIHFANVLDDIITESIIAPAIRTNYMNMDGGIKVFGGINTIATGIRTSTSQNPNLTKEYLNEANNKLISRVCKLGHTSVLEHSNVAVKGRLTIAAYHQLIRHRLVSIDRLKPFENVCFDTDYLLPEAILNSPFAKDVEAYIIYMQHVVMNTGDTRYLLNCTTIDFVLSGNFRAISHICKDRLCHTAQTEIREFMLGVYKLIDNNTDISAFRNEFLPPCAYSNSCKEGAYCCGVNRDEIRKELGAK